MAEIKTIKSKFLKNMFDQNTYVLTNKKEAVIIDAGAELDDVKQAVEGKKVLAVLITHAHFDHTWNLEKYVNEFGCDVYVCDGEEGRFLNSDLNACFMVRLQVSQNIEQKHIKYYAKNLNIGSFDFDVFFTPGHTADGVCILWQKNLFTGDTVFADGVGRTDLADSNPFELVNSLKVIQNIDFEVAYPGHYEPANKNKILDTLYFYL